MLFLDKSSPFTPCKLEYAEPRAIDVSDYDISRRDSNGTRILIARKGRKVFLEAKEYSNIFPLDVPIQVDFELTQECNLRCKHCYLKTKQERYSPATKKALERIIESGVMSVELSGGEPFMVEQVFDTIKYINDNGRLATIATNGTLISEEAAKKLADSTPYLVYVSLDGGRRVNDDIRGKGSFNRTLKGIENLNKYGIRPFISTTVSKFNLHSLPQMSNEIRNLDTFGLFLINQEPSTYDKEFEGYSFDYEELKGLGERIEGMNLKFPRVVTHFKKSPLAESLYFGCFFKLTMCQVTPSGKVLNCPILREDFGNVLQEELGTIWKRMYEQLAHENSAMGERCGGCDWKKRCFPCKLFPKK